MTILHFKLKKITNCAIYKWELDKVSVPSLSGFSHSDNAFYEHANIVFIMIYRNINLGVAFQLKYGR